MVVRTRRQWRGAVRAALVAVKGTVSRLLVWDAKLSSAGNPLFSYTERQMLSAVLPIVEAKLSSVVQIL